ncbi:MAG TPA: glycosyltransferase family 39 protein, partial [Chloroflexota bacterium]|nr:glycosyltransferase family 39 protein [Chloroflexota bacterium]
MMDDPATVVNAEFQRPTGMIRSLITALVVIVLLGVSFLKQLDLMANPAALSLNTYLWLPALGLFAGLGLAFGTGYPLDPLPWPVFSSRRPFSALSLCLAAAALICAADSAILQSAHDSPTTITITWVAGMLLILVAAGWPEAFYRVRAYPERVRAWFTGGWRLARRSSLMLVVILVAAMLLRATALDTIPGFVHFDEAGFGIQARQIVAGQVPTVFSMGFADIPILENSWVAAFLRIFGDNLVALRLSSVVPGVLSIWLLALLGKEIFNPRVSLLAAGLLTVSFYHIHY